MKKIIILLVFFSSKSFAFFVEPFFSFGTSYSMGKNITGQQIKLNIGYLFNQSYYHTFGISSLGINEKYDNNQKEFQNSALVLSYNFEKKINDNFLYSISLGYPVTNTKNDYYEEDSIITEEAKGYFFSEATMKYNFYHNYYISILYNLTILDASYNEVKRISNQDFERINHFNGKKIDNKFGIGIYYYWTDN